MFGIPWAGELPQQPLPAALPLISSTRLNPLQQQIFPQSHTRDQREMGRMTPNPIPFPVEWPEFSPLHPKANGRWAELRLYFQLLEQEGIGLRSLGPSRALLHT